MRVMMKKLCTLLLASALLLSSASVARAQTPIPERWDLVPPLRQEELITQSGNTITFWGYLSSVFSGITGAAANQILSPSGAPSAVSGLGRAIAVMTGNPPVQTAQYLAYMGQKAGFVDQAYAQDGGFGVLQPIQSIWVATRNVAYLITSLTLVVIGFMIMMRKKLDAQTVIGIQQALPSIVITLLLITFSYAIAGFMIDLLYFVLYFILQLFGDNIFQGGDAKTAIDFITTHSVFSVVVGGLFGGGASSADSAAKAIAQLVDSLFAGAGIAGFIGAGVGKLVQGVGIGSLIVSGALLFAMVKLFFSLLTSYAMILLATIFGPLMLMTNAIPGSNAFGTWIKNLAGNVAVFPATAIFIVLAAALMGNANPNFNINSTVGFGASGGTSAWAPPLLFGAASSGAPGTSPVEALMALVGLGMLLLTPQFVEMVKKAFQTAGGEGYGSAIGQALQYGYSGRYSPMGALTGGVGPLSVATGGIRTAAGAPLGVAGGAMELQAARTPMGAMMHPEAATAQRFGRFGKAIFLAKRALGK